MVRALVLAVALLAAGGCYRVSYTTGRPPGRATTLWNDFYAVGLIGEVTIDARKICPEGVARIVTYQHVHHLLLTVITAGIYAPRGAQVVCAAGGPPAGGAPPPAAPGSGSSP